MHIKSCISLFAIVLAAGLCTAATLQPAVAGDRSPPSDQLSGVQSFTILGQVPPVALTPMAAGMLARTTGEGVETADLAFNGFNHIGTVFTTPALTPVLITSKVIQASAIVASRILGNDSSP